MNVKANIYIVIYNTEDGVVGYQQYFLKGKAGELIF